MSDMKKMIINMPVQELKKLLEIVPESEKSLVETEIHAKETITAINEILTESGFRLEELFNKLRGSQIATISVEGRNRPRPLGTAKFMLDGIVYDGRTARRAKEFAKFVKDERVDMNHVVEYGALNPDWLDEQPERVLVAMGIHDLERYKSDHGMQNNSD